MIVEVETKRNSGDNRLIGKIIKVVGKRVNYYSMTTSFLGFSLRSRWTTLEQLYVAQPHCKKLWRQAERRNAELVKAHREAALSRDDEPLPPEAAEALRKLVKGYASSL